MATSDEPLLIDPSVPISESFSELPTGFKSFIKTGFALAAKLVSQGKTAELVKLAVDEGGGPISRSVSIELAKRFILRADEIPKLVSALAFATSALVAQKMLTAEEFVATGIRLEFINSENKIAMQQLLEAALQSRTPIVELAERNRVARRILPSLTSFSTMVDIRPAFNEDSTAIKFSVPVVIAQIENDSSDDIWIQMSKKQVRDLIDDLQSLLNKIDVAEKWAEGKS